MTLTLELSPTEEARLAAAANQKGLDPAIIVRQLMTEHLPEAVNLPATENQTEYPALALFAQWEQDSIHMREGQGMFLLSDSPLLQEIPAKTLREIASPGDLTARRYS